MATCPGCFVGRCSKHPKLDHGRAKAGLLKQEKVLNSMHTALVKERLEKMKAAFG
eukprot:CAMPEP_0205926790 /NCGR_PEP_ID=MMETSP1325-20131115/21213_1 /ASSEMBLY_ACC=CAM_ASM_000708 /TAXON_ID=236786 /ORGANISM="Florenciella sp., Strain RCC1007" /LENGTH=54 /DNA_ID=CAMNT_0053295559 /DNA_START=46 /DNA_END=207 /DNA_ORIENTATION=+